VVHNVNLIILTNPHSFLSADSHRRRPKLLTGHESVVSKRKKTQYRNLGLINRDTGLVPCLCVCVFVCGCVCASANGFKKKSLSIIGRDTNRGGRVTF
jgi:hypothetical protein